MSRDVIKASIAKIAADKISESIEPNNYRKRSVVMLNISSTQSSEGYLEGFPYIIAKSANLGLTKCMAK